MKKSKCDIIFCGLIRRTDLLEKSIKDFNKLRKKGLIDKIILSTWVDEAEKNPEIISFLKKNKVIILAKPQPADPGVGNIWCQMKSFETGLSKSKKNNFVLRTRTDVYINPEFLEYVFKNKESLLKITYNLPRNIFKFKVWIPWAELTQPFFIADECFFANHEDSKFLINYNPMYDEKYNLGAEIAHVRRFIEPFLKDYPIFYNALKPSSSSKSMKNFFLRFFKPLYIKLWHYPLIKRFSQYLALRDLNKNLNQKPFIELLSVYYSVLYSHFYIKGNFTPNQVIYRDYFIPPKISDEEKLEDFFAKKYAGPKGNLIRAFDDDFLDRLFNKRFAESKLLDDFSKSIEEFNHL